MTPMMELATIVAVYIVAALATVTVLLLLFHAIQDWFNGLDDIPKSDNHGKTN